MPSLDQTIFSMERNAENDISAIYADALKRAMRENREPLRRIKAIMDGDEKPPHRYVTDQQKARWRQKELIALLDSSGIIERIATTIADAGDAAVERIQQHGVDVYKTAYNSVEKRLRR